MTTFLKNELPAHIDRPFTFVSVISRSPDLQPALDELLTHTFHHKCETALALHIIDSAAGCAKHYNIRAKSETGTLEASSLLPNLLLTLDEHTYYHNAYIGRHTKFQKLQPFKGAVEIDTRFAASIDRSKRSKDFDFLCRSVFDKATVDIISDTDVLGRMDVEHENCHGHFRRHALNTPVFTKQLEMDAVSDHEELYEFMSLVHLNALPDHRNSHVAATLMYAPPDVRMLDFFDAELYSYTLADTNPLLLYELAGMPEVLSVLAVSPTHNYLFVKSQELHLWTAQLKPQ